MRIKGFRMLIAGQRTHKCIGGSHLNILNNFPMIFGSRNPKRRIWQTLLFSLIFMQTLTHMLLIYLHLTHQTVLEQGLFDFWEMIWAFYRALLICFEVTFPKLSILDLGFSTELLCFTQLLRGLRFH